VAWLTTSARNKGLSRLRRERTQSKLRNQVKLELECPTLVTPDEPDLLRLIFTCCHPALNQEAQVALTLRTVGGLTTPEVARAILQSEPTIAKRLVRAKHKIREAHIPYRVPPDHLMPERLASVLAVVYLIFNAGYVATAGDSLIRRDQRQDTRRASWSCSRNRTAPRGTEPRSMRAWRCSSALFASMRTVPPVSIRSRPLSRHCMRKPIHRM